MTGKKILLFGHTGYIGSEFKKQLGASAVLAPSHDECCEYSDMVSLIKKHNPDFIINAAGYTGKPNVDACELQQDDCYIGNVTYPVAIADAADSCGVPFGHVSSGCIYNGYEKDFTEEDEPNFSFKHNNCSFYSGTKADCEAVLMEHFENLYVWRLRIPFEENANPRNYITKMLTYDKILSLPNSLSHKEEFVEICLKMIKMKVPYGIYNVVNEGSLTAKELFDMMHNEGKYTTHDIENKKFYDSLEEFNKDVVAARSNCVLSVEKLKGVGIHPRTIKEAMLETIKNYN